MAELNSGLDAGDEVRRHGDYVGFPHQVSDGTAKGNISSSASTPLEGEPVNIDDNGNLQRADAGSDVDIVGVMYTYPYYGDSSNNGPFVDGSEDATVGLDGEFVVDFSNVTATPSAGDVLGSGNEMVVLADPNGDNLAPVRMR